MPMRMVPVRTRNNTTEKKLKKDATQSKEVKADPITVHPTDPHPLGHTNLRINGSFPNSLHLRAVQPYQLTTAKPTIKEVV